MSLKPSLADRLRAVVGTAPSAVPRVDTGEPAPSGEGTAARVAQAAAVLGGTVHESVGGRCIVVDRYYAADDRHGRLPIAGIVRTLQASVEGFTTLGRAWPGTRGVVPAEGPLLQDLDGLCVVDLETTGLAGGAGTQAFLVGCARLDGEGVHVRQFLSPGFEHERAQLQLVAEWMRDRTQLLTFNGRTFDVPLLEMRFSYHRLAWPWDELPHLDALHPARRFWRDRPELLGPDPDDASCSLTVLERRLSGVHRVGDVPGFEIPARYFQFARDGRPEPLAAVLEHNRLDLLSTLLVCARASALVVLGPGAAENGHECLGLGRLHDRLGRTDDADACYTQAAATGARTGDGRLRGEALRRLALVRRRAGRPAEAAEAWRDLLATRGASALARREAREALAIFHEHRARDLETARALVLDALAEPLAARHRGETEHRLARLERKLSRSRTGSLIAQLDDEPSEQSNSLD
ncbi:MAG: ribonuclease H-like domain-containing protein [Vicinamibacterales bacterium]